MKLFGMERFQKFEVLVGLWEMRPWVNSGKDFPGDTPHPSVLHFMLNGFQRVMNKIFYATAVLFLFLIGSVSAQFADPAVSGAFFGPNEVEVGQTSTLNISFSNSGSTAIPVNSIELTISTADNFYTSDGTTPPTGAGASLFTWTYLGSDIWRGQNTSVVPAFGGGDILLPVTGTAVTSGFETTNINVQPTANFTAFTNAPGNDNLQPELKINVAQSPSLAIDDITVDEDAGNAVLTVSLSAAPSAPVSLDFGTAPGTAGAGDFTPTSGTLNLAAGQTSGTITIPITDDSDDEPDETFNVNLSNPSGLIIADGTGVVTILDNDDPAPLPDLSIDDVTVAEGAGSALLTVSLSAPSVDPVTVNFATAPGTAGTGDFTSVASTLNIPAGQIGGTIVVPITDDSDDEPNESFSVNISDPANANIADGTGTVTIIDNDDPAPLPDLSINDVSVVEGAGSALLTVSLSAPSTDPVTVNFATAPGTAGTGDFTSVASTLNIPAGQTSGTIVVPITDDNDDEQNETFSVNLSNPANANIADGTGTVTIIDNDDPAPLPNLSINDVSVDEGAGNATLTVSLSAPSTDPVTVNFATAPGTAGTGDFTSVASTLNIPAGQTSGTIVVPITDDNDDEPDETFSVNLSNPANANIADGTAVVTIIDNDDPTAPDCDDIVITTTSTGVTVSGLDGAPVTSLQVFTSTYQQEFSCFADCSATENVALAPGTYFVFAKYYTASYQLICEVQETVTINGTGPCAGLGGDSDGDGVCDDDDCQPNSAAFPATPGSPCNDGNPDTTDDMVTADGCGCAGTPTGGGGPDCDDIVIAPTANGVTVSGLDGAPVTSLQIFTIAWQPEFSCFASCDAVQDVALSPGSYIVFAKYYTASYQLICEVQETVTIGGSGPCAGSGGDSDGDGVCDNDDCQPFNAAFPATPGSPCNDGNPGTTNDMVTTDGCGCMGTPVSGCDNYVNAGTIGFGSSCSPSVDYCPGTGLVPSISNCGGPTGGSGDLEVVWLQSTTSCTAPTSSAADILAGLDPNWSVLSTVNALSLSLSNVTESTCYIRCVRRSGCDNYIESNIISVNIPSNCGGSGDPDCADIIISTNASGISVAGLDGAPIASLQVFTSTWQPEFSCFADCDAVQDVSLSAGTYFVYAKYYTAGYQLICEVNETVTINGSNPCAGAGGDSDGDGICDNDDCLPFNPAFPATPGSACSDGNPNTINDTVTPDGCGCEGTVVTTCDNYSYAGLIGFGGTCVSNIDHCPGSGPVTLSNCASPSGGSGNLEVVWLKSTTSCSYPTADPMAGTDPHWTVLSTSNNLSITLPDVTENTCFLRCVRRDGCVTYTESNIISLDVPAGCGSGTPDCANVDISAGNGSITTSGLLGAPIVGVQIFNSSWQQVHKCFADCPGNSVSWPVSAGTYYVYVKYYTAGYQLICERQETVHVAQNLVSSGNKLIELDAVKHLEHTELVWKDNQGHEVEGYILERSADGVEFEEINHRASEGTNGLEVYYDYDLEPLTGDNFYRVRLLRTDGSTGFTNVKLVHYLDLADYVIFPNPANSFATVNLESAIGRQVNIQVFNNLGVRLKSFDVGEVNSRYYQMDLRDLHEGHYVIWLEVEGRRAVAKTLVVGKI